MRTDLLGKLMDPGRSMKCFKEHLQELPIFDCKSNAFLELCFSFFSRLRLCFKKLEAEKYLEIDTPESRTHMERDLILILWKLTRIFQQARRGGRRPRKIPCFEWLWCEHELVFWSSSYWNAIFTMLKALCFELNSLIPEMCHRVPFLGQGRPKWHVCLCD